MISQLLTGTKKQDNGITVIDFNFSAVITKTVVYDLLTYWRRRCRFFKKKHRSIHWQLKYLWARSTNCCGSLLHSTHYQPPLLQLNVPVLS